MPTIIRHKILLVEPGTGLSSGQAIIDNVLKIERADFASYADLHQVRSPEGYAIIDKWASKLNLHSNAEGHPCAAKVENVMSTVRC